VATGLKYCGRDKAGLGSAGIGADLTTCLCRILGSDHELSVVAAAPSRLARCGSYTVDLSTMIAPDAIGPPPEAACRLVLIVHPPSSVSGAKLRSRSPALCRRCRPPDHSGTSRCR
jgi:hypothetical protein